MPARWTTSPPPPETRAIGDQWATDQESAVLRVPSAVVPLEFNYVFNPDHPDWVRVRRGPTLKFPFDPRLASRR